MLLLTYSILLFKAYINLDMNAALRGLTLNPRQSVEKEALNPLVDANSQSEGEFRVGRLDPANLLLYGGKQNPGTNRIHRNLENGEVGAPVSHGNIMGLRPATMWANSEASSQQQARKMSSEGEVENPAERQKQILENKLKDLSLRSSTSSKKKTKKSPKKSPLSMSPVKKTDDNRINATKPSKNTIKIKPIRNVYSILEPLFKF